MSNIRDGLLQWKDPDKSIGLLLLDFYNDMKDLEEEDQAKAKQAVRVVMAINDIKKIYEQESTRS